MAVSVKHAFVSPVVDAGNPDEVGPNEWNDEHTVVGLGTAAEADVGDFATAAQGALADSATQPGDLAAVATSGAYADLSGKPTLGTAAATDATDYATAAQGAKADTALQSVVQGTGITVDNTDPLNPVISATGGGSGDMTAAVYDPQNIASDAFARANHTGTQTASTISDFNAAADARVAAAVGVSVQAYDADLSTWAGVSRASGFDTFVATPSSANLAALVADETGTGSLVLATSPTITTPTISGASGAQAPLSASLTDTSSVVANAAKMWNPTYFGNAGTAVVHKFNRVMVGEATVGSTDLPMSTPDWLETLVPNSTQVGQLASVSATGNLGVLGASRTSDFRAWAGGTSGGSQGVTGFGWNDDTTAATTPIAVGAEFRGFRKATVAGITLGAQISAANEGSTVDSSPSAAVVSGTTAALLITNGPGPSGYSSPISAGLIFGADTSYLRKGVVFDAAALDPALGAGGAGVAVEIGRSQSVRWLNSGGTADAELWGNASGFHVAAASLLGTNLANYVTITGSATTQPIISVDGSATDVDLYMRPKGLGTVIAQKLDAATSSVSIPHQIRHSLSSGTAAAGIGVGQNFVIVNASAVNKIIASQEAVTTDVTNATEDADFVWKLMAAGAAAAEKLRLSSVGKLTAQGGVVSVDPLNGSGYATGAGGAVTQATSKSTGVTLNKVCGQITTHNASLAANTTVIFTVTDSAVAATDVVRVSIGSGGTAGAYLVWVSATAAGSFNVAVRNITGGALGEALVLNFAVAKAVAA